MKSIIKNILLVDDSPNDITLIKAALANAHLAHDIVVAENGEEALDFLYKRGSFVSYPGGDPVFILLDIKMPLMSGIEVLKLIRSDPAYNKVPVIMLTSSHDSRDLQECYDNGANSYVVKPVNINFFMGAINDLGKYWVIINEPGE